MSLGRIQVRILGLRRFGEEFGIGQSLPEHQDPVPHPKINRLRQNMDLWLRQENV